MDTLFPFSPAVYPWKDALQLNAMYQIYLNDCYTPDSGNLLRCTPFAAPSNTLGGADRLSLYFLRDGLPIRKAITPIDIYFDPDNAVRANELRKIFTPESEGTFLMVNSPSVVDIYQSLKDLRVSLWTRFATGSSPIHSVGVYSPAVYGRPDACLLNGLQAAMEHHMRRDFYRVEGYPFQRFERSFFTQSVGSMFDADWVSLYFYGMETDIMRSISIAPETMDDACKRALLYEEGMDLRLWISNIRQELALLRRRLYTSPRSVAFMMAMHRRLGAGSPVAALGSEMCQLVLATVGADDAA